MTELAARDIIVEADGIRLVDGAGFSLRQGELTALLGPNGAGKTSLVQACLGLRKATGSILLDGAGAASLDPAERARRIAYLPQTRPLAWPCMVRDVVALGRFCHGAALGRLGKLDAEAVDRAIEDCGLARLAHHSMDTLSGGETARVHCARVFAAETPLLIADEPTVSLDPRHQFLVLDLLRRYVKRGGGVLSILHDVRHAALYATRLLWMKEGRILAEGTPGETLSADRLREIYGVRARVEADRFEITGAS